MPGGIISTLSPSFAHILVDLLDTVVVVASAIVRSVPAPEREPIVVSDPAQLMVDGVSVEGIRVVHRMDPWPNLKGGLDTREWSSC